MNEIYDLISSFLNTENAAAGISGYESLPTGKPLTMKKEEDEESEELSAKIQKIRNTFKEMKK